MRRLTVVTFSDKFYSNEVEIRFGRGGISYEKICELEEKIEKSGVLASYASDYEITRHWIWVEFEGDVAKQNSLPRLIELIGGVLGGTEMAEPRVAQEPAMRNHSVIPFGEQIWSSDWRDEVALSPEELEVFDS